MALTQAQLVTFGNDIRANGDQDVIDALAAGNNNAIRDWYNNVASPDFWVFHENVDVDEAIKSGVDWATDYAALDEKDMTVLQLMFHNGSYAVETPNARDGLNQVFSGATASKNAMLTLATHQATEFEKVFGSTTTGPGGGDGSAQGQAAIAVVKGPCSRNDVRNALEATA